MPRIYPCGGEPVRLVSTDWLADRPSDEGLMILDVQPNIHDYVLEHIPGAIYLHEGLFRTYKKNQPARFVPSEAIRPILSGAGLKPDQTVVVYTGVGGYKGWGDGLEQTMVAYSLCRYGHNDVCVLDGGLDKWKTEGKPVAKDYPEVDPSDFPVEVRSEYYIDYEEFKRIKDRDDVIVLHARPPMYMRDRGPGGSRGISRGPSTCPGSLSWTAITSLSSREKTRSWRCWRSTVSFRKR